MFSHLTLRIKELFQPNRGYWLGRNWSDKNLEMLLHMGFCHAGWHLLFTRQRMSPGGHLCKTGAG